MLTIRINPEVLAMPANHGFRLDDVDRITPSGPNP